MSFVLDNSVTMRWCFGDGSSRDLDYAASLVRTLRSETAEVPAIWSLEVANVLARAESTGRLPASTMNTFLRTLLGMRIHVDPDTTTYALTDILNLARKHRLSAYDAAYLELAARKHLPLATLDAALRKAAKRAGVKVF